MHTRLGMRHWLATVNQPVPTGLARTPKRPPTPASRRRRPQPTPPLLMQARNLRNILEFLADPSPERVQRHLQRLLAAAVEDRWPRAHKAVFAVLAQSWGARVLGRDHITPRAVHQQYELLRERLKDLADGEQGGGGAEDRLLGGEEEAWEGAEGEDGEEEAEVAAEAAPVAVNRGPRRSRPPAEDGRHLL